MVLANENCEQKNFMWHFKFLSYTKYNYPWAKSYRTASQSIMLDKIKHK